MLLLYFAGKDIDTLHSRHLDSVDASQAPLRPIQNENTHHLHHSNPHSRSDLSPHHPHANRYGSDPSECGYNPATNGLHHGGFKLEKDNAVCDSNNTGYDNINRGLDSHSSPSPSKLGVQPSGGNNPYSNYSNASQTTTSASAMLQHHHQSAAATQMEKYDKIACMQNTGVDYNSSSSAPVGTERTSEVAESSGYPSPNSSGKIRDSTPTPSVYDGYPASYPLPSGLTSMQPLNMSTSWYMGAAATAPNVGAAASGLYPQSQLGAYSELMKQQQGQLGASLGAYGDLMKQHQGQAQRQACEMLSTYSYT